MKPEDKSKRQTAQARRTYKTKDDFLRWLRKQNDLKKQAVEEQIWQADPAITWALMVWADDGGHIANIGVPGDAMKKHSPYKDGSNNQNLSIRKKNHE
jgi:hypothetical protein